MLKKREGKKDQNIAYDEGSTKFHEIHGNVT